MIKSPIENQKDWEGFKNEPEYQIFKAILKMIQDGEEWYYMSRELGVFKEYLERGGLPEFTLRINRWVGMLAIFVSVGSEVWGRYRQDTAKLHELSQTFMSLALVFASIQILSYSSRILKKRLTLEPFADKLKDTLIDRVSGDEAMARDIDSAVDNIFRSNEIPYMLKGSDFIGYIYLALLTFVLSFSFMEFGKEVTYPVDKVVNIIEDVFAEVVKIVAPESETDQQISERRRLRDLSLTFEDINGGQGDYHITNITSINTSYNGDNFKVKEELENLLPFADVYSYRKYKDNFIPGMILTYPESSGVYGFQVKDINGVEIAPSNFQLYYYPFTGIYSLEYIGEDTSAFGTWVVEWFAADFAQRDIEVPAEAKEFPFSLSEAQQIVRLVHDKFGNVSLARFGDILSQSYFYSVNPDYNPLHVMQFDILDFPEYFASGLNQQTLSCYPTAILYAMYDVALQVVQASNSSDPGLIKSAWNSSFVYSGYFSDDTITQRDLHAWNRLGDFTPNKILEMDMVTQRFLRERGGGQVVEAVNELEFESRLKFLLGWLSSNKEAMFLLIAATIIAAMIPYIKLNFNFEGVGKVLRMKAFLDSSEEIDVIKLLQVLKVRLGMNEGLAVLPPLIEASRIREIIEWDTNLGDGDLSENQLRILNYLVQSVEVAPEAMLDLNKSERKIVETLYNALIKQLGSDEVRFAP